MAAEFLRKLLGRSDPLPPEVREAVAELTCLARENPTLAGPADVLRAALLALYAESLQTTPPTLTGEQAWAKLAAGVPLLRGETLPLDRDAFARRWQAVCAAVQRHHDSTTAPAVAAALQRGVLDADQLTAATLAGHPETIHARADELGLDAGLTATVLRLTLFPVLCQINLALTPLRAGRRWEHGYCSTCGSWPLLGEFRGLEQTRWLRCGLCASAWEFPRLRCPFCETSDHRQLGYFHAEAEEGQYRAATCAVCRGYVKIVSTLTELTPPQLLVTDLATLHLDLIAAERGYAVPTVNPTPERM